MVPLKGFAFFAWISFGLGSILYAVLATTYERTLIFKEPIPDKALPGYVIRTEQVPDEGSCRVKCYLEPNCVSINVGPATEGQFTCDLNNHTDESSSHFALEERKHYIHYAVENLCHGDPCPVSVSVCQVGFTNKGYRCACREGYLPIGDHGQCEDLNECTAQGGNNCSPNANCINTLGSFECRCRAGYIGDGVVCKPDRGGCDFDSDGFCHWWTNDTSFNASFQWLLGTGSTSSSSTGPLADHTSGSGKYLYVEASSPAQHGDKARLLSTQFPATAGRCLSFWYHMYGSSTGSLNVYVKNKDFQSNLVWSKSGEQEDKWIQAKVSLTSNSSYEVMIEAVRGVNFRGDIGLDDISFTDGPCVEEVGCFYDNSNERMLPTLVKNLRPEIDWYHLEKTIQKCALLSKQRNFQIFGVQFYGECWSRNTSNIHYDRYRVARKSKCRFGVGEEYVNAVYRILP